MNTPRRASFLVVSTLAFVVALIATLYSLEGVFRSADFYSYLTKGIPLPHLTRWFVSLGYFPLLVPAIFIIIAYLFSLLNRITLIFVVYYFALFTTIHTAMWTIALVSAALPWIRRFSQH